jgi:hypothetical protein
MKLRLRGHGKGAGNMAVSRLSGREAAADMDQGVEVER